MMPFIKASASTITTWIRDPFGRKRLVQRHTEVISEIRTMKKLVHQTNRKYDHQSFPIGDMVGSQVIRRKRIPHD